MSDDHELRLLERQAQLGDVAARTRLEHVRLRTGFDEQEHALARLHHGGNCFLTGPAGTGKSTVIRRFVEEARQQGRRVLVSATTGVAALALKGSTIHRVTGVPVKKEPRAREELAGFDEPMPAPAGASPKSFAECSSVDEFLRAGEQEPLFDGLLHGDELADAINLPIEFRALVGGTRHSDLLIRSYDERWRTFTASRLCDADVLILDEVSMADARLLDHASWLCAIARSRGTRAYRNVSDRPFGGLQVIFLGDLGQLPPVDERWGWAYESAAWRALDVEVLSLTRVQRQSDPAFAELLSRLRVGDLAPADKRVLLSRVNAFDPGSAPRILSTNAECEAVNQAALATLPGQMRLSRAIESGPSALLRDLDHGCASPRELRLKVGARVLLTANDSSEELRFANGSAGTVRAFGERSRLGMVCVRVELDAGGEVLVPRITWSIEETARSGRATVTASREQYPLRLGYALTAHRAQGATLDRASVDLSKTFASGGAYVALSRVRTLEGLNLESSKHGTLSAHPKFLEWERNRKAS